MRAPSEPPRARGASISTKRLSNGNSADGSGLGSEAILRRCLQANFATALDARYGIAQGVLWSTFLHPLGSLDERLFLSGLGQTVTLARTYGTTFQSGELAFGGGDAPEAGEGPAPAGGGRARESDL
jgi:hypothetical protein